MGMPRNVHHSAYVTKTITADTIFSKLSSKNLHYIAYRISVPGREIPGLNYHFKR